VESTLNNIATRSICSGAVPLEQLCPLELPMIELIPELHEALRKSRRFLRAMTAELTGISDDALEAGFRSAMARAAERMSISDAAAPTDDELISWENLAARLAALPWSCVPEEL
jgi:hypothetical protein